MSTSVETYLCRLTAATAKNREAQPLAGHGNQSALGGDAKNSEEAVRNLRCLSRVSYVDFRLRALSFLQEAPEALTFGSLRQGKEHKRNTSHN